MGHFLVPAGAVVLLLPLLSGCGGQAASAIRPSSAAYDSGLLDGAVTGIAAVCPGAVPPQRGPRLRVTARRGQRAVAHQWVYAGARDTGGRYRLLLPPGDYVVSAPASGAPPAAVHVRAGGTITVNFPQHCT